MFTHRFVGGSVAIAALAVLSACGSTTHKTHGTLDPAGVRPAAAANRQVATRSPSAPTSSATTSSAATPVATTPGPSAPAATATAAATSAASAVAADGGYQAAMKFVEEKGFDPEIAPWHSDHWLNAIGGILKASADGRTQRVFFFVNGRYIGLDATKPSGDVRVANTSYDMVTVSYAIYRPSDALCCPSSRQSVRFQWTGSKLVPLDPIPPSANGTVAGR